MAERFSCSVASVETGEPCFATASQVRRWILVEQPGSWGAAAVVQSGIPIDIATRLRAAARAAGARLLLIRRHGRSDPQVRNCFAVVSTQQRRRVERFGFTDPADLLAIDWSPLRRFEAVGGEPWGEPLYLVCTNGSHDTCCARFGRPVAAALDAAFPDQIWESSHYGGDRFAGNLVMLPDGIYNGRVTPDNAADVLTAHRDGRISLEHYRGRSFEPFVAQAAEHFVRVEHGLTGIDDVLPNQVDDLGDGTFRVLLETATGASLAVTLTCAPSQQAQQLTCSATSLEHPPRYHLISLAEA